LLREVADAGAAELEYDVLVDGEARVVHRNLTDHGARRLVNWGRAPHRQYTWWDPSAQRLVRLDLVDELSFGPVRELRIDVRKAVLDAVTERDGVPRPSPSNEQWLALLHGLLDRDRFRPRDVDRLDEWVGTDDDVVAAALLPSTRAELVSAIRSSDWDAVERFRPRVLAELRQRQRLAAGARRAWRRSMTRTTKVQRAILRPGVRVALLGPDGAGKSTTIETLKQSGVVATSVYLGVAPAQQRSKAVAVPGIALLRTIRRLIRAWLTATIRRRRGESVALDRHPLEATIGPPTSKRTTLARRWILAHLLPRPEVVVVLTAPPEVLHQRKPEHDLDDAVARHGRYLELARRHGLPVVDTTAAPSDVVAQISRIVHERGRRRRS
jgi:thymidylate kinase